MRAARRRARAGPLVTGLFVTALVASLPLGSVGLGDTALADEGTVLVVGQQGPARLRLAAEVRALGFVPEAVTVEEPLDVPGLEALARDHDALAAVYIAPSSSGATVWVVDRVTGKVLLRHIEAPADGDDVQALVAVRAAELLRASLLEVQEEHESRGEVPATEAVEALVAPIAPPPPEVPPEPIATAPAPEPAPTVHRIRVSMGLAIGGSVDGVGALGRITLGLSARVHRHLGLALRLEVPLSPATVEDVEGSAELHAGALAMFLNLPLLPADARFGAHIGAGIVVGYFRSTGRAAAPYLSREDRLVRVAPALELAASLQLSERLAVGAALRAAYSPDAVVLRFAGRRVASYGQPELFGQLVLAAALD